MLRYHGMRSYGTAALAFGLALFSFGPARAAGPTLSGFVHDPDGRPIASARLVLSGKAHTQRWSDAAGTFQFQELIPGSYVLSADKAGFIAGNVDVTVGAGTTRVDVVLEAATFSTLKQIAAV